MLRYFKDSGFRNWEQDILSYEEIRETALTDCTDELEAEGRKGAGALKGGIDR